MGLTDRERRIIAELESRLSTGTPDAPPPPAPRTLRPQWTVVPAAVLGSALLVAGIVLGVADAVLVGALLSVWWLAPLLWTLSCRAGRFVLASLENTPPPGPMH